MFHQRIALLLAAALLAGCPAVATDPLAKVPSVPGATSPPIAIRTRTVEVRVEVPNRLGAGKIINADPSGIVAGGGLNLVAGGGGNIVAAGGGNFLPKTAAARTGQFGLLASRDQFSGVEQAVIYFETLDGTRFNQAALSDASGVASFAKVADGRDLVVVAEFKYKDKLYKLAAAVATGDMKGTIQIDPINTIVQGRIKTILKDNKIASSKLAFTKLAEVWGVFNTFNIDIDLAAIESGKTLADLDGFYQKAIDQLKAIDTDEGRAGVKTIVDYMAELKGSAK